MRPASDASLAVAIGIPGIAIVMLVVLTLLVARYRLDVAARFALVIALLAGGEMLLAQSGLLARTNLFPPPFLLLMIPLTMLTVRTALSSFGEALARTTPMWTLVILQGFRLPLELLMHRAAAEHIMPPQMTWTGLNFDVVTGASALLLGVFLFFGGPRYRLYRGLVLAWSAMGLGLLLAVVAIALSSMPAFALFGPMRTNEWITQVPFVWLPGVLVETALFLHLLTIRKITFIREAQRPDCPEERTGTLPAGNRPLQQ